jgi:hypothetical protein
MPNQAQPGVASSELSDVPLIVEDLLTELDDLRTSDGDTVLIGELWAQAVELLRR